MITVDMIDLENEVIIKNIKGEDKMRRRFYDLGFLPKNKVKCVLVSPFKDPKAYKINENIIAIRNIDAKNIEVTYEKY